MSSENDAMPSSPKGAEEVSLPISPEANHVPTENTTITNVFHPLADVTLVVKGASAHAEYQVSGMNLTVASDVLGALIYGKGGQKKALSDVKVTLDIGDVDLEAFVALLHIIHFHFTKVPTESSLDKLFDITTLTAKYKCTALIMPWATEWLLPHVNLQKNESCITVNHKAAFIAWELGSAKLLRKMIKSMTTSAKVDSDGDLVHATGTKLKDLVLPAGILDEIVTIRAATLDKILSSIQAAIDNITNKTGDAKYCKTGEETDNCETMMLGSALAQLLRSGLFPVPTAASYKESVDTLVSYIDGIALQHWEGRNYAPHKGHSGCSLLFKENARAAMKQMSDPLKEAHLQHLEEQSAASGVIDADDADAEKQGVRTRITDTISGSGELLSRSRSTSLSGGTAKSES
ncbi:hypothetical protein PG987_007473 [Apiospora arundinis]